MKKITFVKERRENVFGTFEDIESITVDYILNQESDESALYCKVWNKMVVIKREDIISIEG